MARRNGRPGAHLATDDYTGFTVYADRLQRDYWGSLTVNPLERNLQEIASPLNDPHPVDIYRGPNYESSFPNVGYNAPEFVGNTNVPTNPNNAAIQALDLFPGIGDMEIGLNFIVY